MFEIAERGRLNEEEAARYMRMVCWLRRNPVHAAWLILGLRLSAHQRMTLREMWCSTSVILKFNRGGGKSFIDAVYLVLVGLLYKGATQIVLTKGFRGGKLVMKEGCEPIILGTLDGQIQKRYAIRCLDNYRKTPRQTVVRVINKDPDMWQINFSHGSDVKTGPLGSDVSKSSAMRGVRANTSLVLDEAADIGDELYTSVIRPFSRVATNPVAGAGRKRSKPFSKIESGTVKYEWQRYTREIDFVEKKMREGDKDYVVIEFNYEDMFHFIDNKQSSPGKRDLKAEMANGNMVITYQLNFADIQDELDNADTPVEDFLAENKNLVVRSVGTEFTTQLMESVAGNEIEPEYLDEGDDDIESVYHNSGKFDRLLRPLVRSKDKCVLGVDPARERDDGAFVLGRIGKFRKCRAPFNDIINATTRNNVEYRVLYEVIVDYYLERFPNIQLIMMDAGGGGYAIRDMLWRPDKPGRVPIYDPNDEDTPFDVRENGNPILRMNQATNESNTFRATFTKAQLQGGRLQFPPFEYHVGNKELDEQYRSIRKIRQQFTYVVSQPSGNWKKYTVDSKYKKDLFSATLLMMQGIYELVHGEQDNVDVVSEYAWIK